MSITAKQSSPIDPIAERRDDSVFLTTVGRHVREARDRRGMSRRALAQAAEVSERYLAQLENGDGNASIVLLRRVATALGVEMTELLADGAGSVEHRLIRRFLDRLPPHRLEDVVFRLMRDFGHKEATRRRRIALIGLRGAGKSSLGAALSKELHLPFIELDHEIERDAGIPLAEIFMLYGQAGYRRIERRCLERAVETDDPMIISVGGGIVSEPETYNLLLLNCYTIWIKASPEEHMSRVISQGDLRPMEGHAEAMSDLKRILVVREPLYGKADAVIDTGGEPFADSFAKLAHLVATQLHA
jgi:XRE family transcriptional regulator, aerobic/anaerobic benzoate catabolism transcriptional regulator